MKKMYVEAIKSNIITEGEDLLGAIEKSLQRRKLREKDILVVASKVLAVSQNRIRKIKNKREFKELVQREADQIIGNEEVMLTLKNGIFTPWAGIDRSNIKKGYAICWPDHPYEVALELQKKLALKYNLQQLGVIIADSFCAPLRKGVISVAIGYAGFFGVKDMEGKKDIFGNKMKYTRQAVADSLATSAQLLMGETDEKKPFALIKGAPVEFTNIKNDPQEALLDRSECIYAPLYQESSCKLGNKI
jgi:coenzyme F420-0:L-glutamate ligase / coenzyme F420-1:gamma-L-glutamate ligase